MQKSALSTFLEKDVACEVCGRFKAELEMKMSDPEAAKLCDVSLRTIQNWKKKVPIPSDKLAALHQAGLDLHYILTGERNTGGRLSDAVALETTPVIADFEKVVPILMEALDVCRSHAITVNESNLKAVIKSIVKNNDKDAETKLAIFETLASILD